MSSGIELGSLLSAENLHPRRHHGADAELVLVSEPGAKPEPGGPRRTATWLDAAYHSITGMIGAGVLGLPSAMAHLGWAGGLITLALTFYISWHTYVLLVYMHEIPDPDSKEHGGIRRLDRYQELTTHVLGPVAGKWALQPFQLAVLIGIAITYTVIAGNCLALFSQHVSPTGAINTLGGMVIFGIIQILLSMLPSFNELSLVSLLGSLMSVCYCGIATVVSGMERPGPGVSYKPGHGQPAVDHVFNVFNALCTMLFAYGGHNVALEIQATLPSPPSTIPPMLRGVHASFVLTGVCYLLVSVTGFHAFGVGVADNVLASFGDSYGGAVAAANFFVVVHVAAAYQVFSQPVFENVEGHLAKSRGGRPVHLLLRVVLRCLYVSVLTFVAIVVPFFSSLMGLVGAIGITPTTFLLPCLLWVLLKKPRPWSASWCVNWALVWVTGCVGLLGMLGAIYSIVKEASKFSLLGGITD